MTAWRARGVRSAAADGRGGCRTGSAALPPSRTPPSPPHPSPMWRSPAFAIAVAAPSPQPDGVQRGLVGEVIKRFEARGYSLRGLKLMNVERSLAESHYADLSSKPFFGALVDYICSGPVVAMVRCAVLEGQLLSSLCGPALVLILSRCHAAATSSHRCLGGWLLYLIRCGRGAASWPPAAR
jgi:Nucleoside diphosphate kinase